MTTPALQLPCPDPHERALMGALCMFCASEGKDIYASWPSATLWNYLRFHSLHGTLAHVQTHGRITGCGTAWQTDFADLVRIAAVHGHAFQWQPTNPQGDTLFLGDIVATTPDALRSLVLDLVRRWPDYDRYHIFTFRRGQLHRLEPEAFARILGVRRKARMAGRTCRSAELKGVC